MQSSPKKRIIVLSELAIAWFWFMGAAVLYLIPFYTDEVMRGGKGVILLLFGVMGTGMVVGKVLSDRLGVQRIEPGLIPFGSIGMSISTFILFWTGHPALSALSAGKTLALPAMLSTWPGWQISPWPLTDYGEVFSPENTAGPCPSPLSAFGPGFPW